MMLDKNIILLTILAMNVTLFFIQEHCLYESQFGKLAKIGGGYGTEAKSSMDETIDRHGRPYGGCAIVWNPRMQGKVYTVLCNHNRLCGKKITINDFNLLLSNAYMPCDKRMEDANYFEYVDVINEVKQIIHATNPTCVIFGGDLNTDTSRTSPHTRELLQCVVDCCLTMCIDMNESKVPYTYIGPNCNTSRIDHFFNF